MGLVLHGQLIKRQKMVLYQDDQRIEARKIIINIPCLMLERVDVGDEWLMHDRKTHDGFLG